MALAQKVPGEGILVSELSTLLVPSQAVGVLALGRENEELDTRADSQWLLVLNLELVEEPRSLPERVGEAVAVAVLETMLEAVPKLTRHLLRLVNLILRQQAAVAPQELATEETAQTEEHPKAEAEAQLEPRTWEAMEATAEPLVAEAAVEAVAQLELILVRAGMVETHR